MKKEDFKNLFKFILIVILILIVWFAGWLLVDYLETDTVKRGAFGDKFGFINSLFSGIALAGIVYSILLQQKELNLQRQELSDTREEFKDQNFQTTFFNLLKTQQQIANELSAVIWNLKSYDQYTNREINGRKFFNVSKIELLRIEKSLKSAKYLNFEEWNEEDSYHHGPTNDWEADDLTTSRKLAYTFKYYDISKENWEHSKTLKPIEFAKFVYGVFFNKFHFVVGHYFRHIYHILLFLEQSEIEKISSKINNIEKEKIKDEFNQFANFVQAQMSTPELFLLFYNSLSFPKLQKLLIKYNLLENLPTEDLLNIEHCKIEGINLKSRKELLN